MTAFLTIFRRFPKIFKMVPKARRNFSEHFPNIFRRLPKTSEDDSKMFRSYTKNLREVNLKGQRKIVIRQLQMIFSYAMYSTLISFHSECLFLFL